jgi:hypothetical protein
MSIEHTVFALDLVFESCGYLCTGRLLAPGLDGGHLN